MLFKRTSPFARDADTRAWFLADKIFVDADIAGLFQRRQMRAEITVGGFAQLFQLDKVDAGIAAQRVERGHDFQARRLVDDFVAAHDLNLAQPYTTENQQAASH